MESKPEIADEESTASNLEQESGHVRSAESVLFLPLIMFMIFLALKWQSSRVPLVNEAIFGLCLCAILYPFFHSSKISRIEYSYLNLTYVAFICWLHSLAPPLVPIAMILTWIAWIALRSLQRLKKIIYEAFSEMNGIDPAKE